MFTKILLSLLDQQIEKGNFIVFLLEFESVFTRRSKFVKDFTMKGVFE